MLHVVRLPNSSNEVNVHTLVGAKSPMHSSRCALIEIPDFEFLANDGHPCKSLSREKHKISGRALGRARDRSDQNSPLRSVASRLVVPALRRTGRPFAVRDSKESAKKIEFVFSASPETNRWEPLELPPSPSPSSAGPGSLRTE